MMVLRKLAVALLSAGVMLPGLGHALAVKELQTKSALGEPFRAEVELTELGDLTAEEIKVSLASQEEFDRIGIERVYFLADLKFNVVVNQGGRSYINVTSAKPVVEPYLNFVVRIASPGNARLHEVVALLDPPVVVDSAAPEVDSAVSSAPAEAAPVTEAVAPVPAVTEPTAELAPNTFPGETPAATPEAQPPAPVVAEQSKPEAVPVPAPVAPVPAPQSNSDSYKVKSGDTMSGIAQRFRTGEATVPQAMVAIQRANPDAFVGGNVNQLRRNQVLRIPSESQMREISAREAVASVREQTEAWRASQPAQAPKPALEGRQLDATAKPAEPAPAPAPESKPEMKLLGAQSGKAGAAAAGKEQAAAAKPEEARKLTEIKSLQQDAKADKQKLAGKVETLGAKVKANDKQMEVQNAKLAELDAQLKQAKARQEEAAKAATEKAAAAKAVPTKPEAGTPETATAAAPAEGAAAPAEVAPAPKPVAKPKPKVAVVEEPVEEESSLLPVIGGGIAALLAVVGGGWWWNQRRRREEEEAEAAIADLEADGGQPDDGFAADQGEGWEDNNWLEEPAAAAPAATDRVLADPLEEAEQYIAYERYPQASGLLVKAIAAAPERTDLRMKLLEVSARLNDWQHFLEQESWFESAGDLNAIARAEELKAGMSQRPDPAKKDNGERGVIEYTSSSDASGELPSLEDLEMDFNSSVALSSPALETVKDSDFAGDGDLDFSDFETDIKSDAPAQSASEDLSFELDDAAFDSPSAPAAAESDLDFSFNEPAPASTGGSSLGDLEDFENLPDLAPAPEAPKAAKKEDDGLSFSLDDLELGSGTGSADDLSLEEGFDLDAGLEAPAASDAIELSLDQGAGDTSLDDLSMDFEATMKSEPSAAPEPVAVAQAAADDAGLGMDDEFDFLADTDENATKLDLARAYIDMGDMEGARDILQEVVSEGNTTQKDEAKGLLAQVG